MRIPNLIGMMAACSALWGCGAGPPPQQAASVNVDDTAPVRRPGLWRQAMLVEGSQGLGVLSLCLDASADRQLSWWGSSRGLRQGCSQNSVGKRPNGAWRFKSVCEGPGGARTETSGEAIGNFNEKYQLRAETTTQNSSIVELIGTRTISIDAEWQGPCPGGMRPGDARLDNGMTVNLLELAASTAPQL